MAEKNELFVERRDDKSYAVRKPNSERASGTAATQAEAIALAKRLNPEAAIHVARVRNVGPGPDKWRKL